MDFVSFPPFETPRGFNSNPCRVFLLFTCLHPPSRQVDDELYCLRCGALCGAFRVVVFYYFGVPIPVPLSCSPLSGAPPPVCVPPVCQKGTSRRTSRRVGLSPHVPLLPDGSRCAVSICLLFLVLPQSFLHKSLGFQVVMLFHSLVLFLY